MLVCYNVSMLQCYLFLQRAANFIVEKCNRMREQDIVGCITDKHCENNSERVLLLKSGSK